MAAAALFWWWRRPKGATVAPIRTLRLGDFRTAGRGIVEILALFEAGGDGIGDLYNDQTDVGSIADPASDVMLDTPSITLGRVNRQSAGELTFYRSAGDAWADAFEGDGEFTGGAVYVQTVDGLLTLPVATSLADAGTTFVRFNLDTTAQALLDGIETGDRFIVAMARPVPADELLWGTDQVLWGSDELLWAA